MKGFRSHGQGVLMVSVALGLSSVAQATDAIPYTSICNRPSWVGAETTQTTPLPTGIVRTIYVSDTLGNDARSLAEAQNPDTPWKSIAKVNASMSSILPGTAVLFKRGDVFRGTLNLTVSGTEAAPIVIGAYGDSGEAVFKGSVPVTGWSLHQGNVYVANVTTPVKQLFASGTRQTLARHPNSGFLKVTGTHPSGSKAGLVSSEISGDWTGANVRLRSVNYAFESRVVQSQSGSTLTFDSALQYGIPLNYGFYFDNKMEAMDTEGEWFHDVAAGKLYFWAPGGVDPDGLAMEATTTDSAITSSWNRDYVTIQDLRFEDHGSDAIALKGGSTFGYGFRLINNTIKNVGRTGIDLTYGRSAFVDHNTFSDILGVGIRITSDASGAVVSNNDLQRIGMVPGLGQSGLNGSTGIYIAGGSGANIRENYVSRTGYNGIRADGGAFIVEKNIAADTLQTLDDGGGIYTWGTSSVNSILRKNFSCRAKGERAGSGATGASLAFAMYVDNYASYLTIENNTLTGGTAGGLLLNSGSHHHTIRNNVIYNNEYSQINFSDSSGNSVGSILTGNVLYSLSENQWPLNMASDMSSYDFGSSDGNYYMNPFNEYVIQSKNKVNGSYAYDYFYLDKWKAKSGDDPSSRTSPSLGNACQATATTSGALITNSSFTSGKSGWTCWTNTGSCALNVQATSQMEGNALRTDFTPNGTSASPNVITYAAAFPLVQDAYYRLRFRIGGNAANEDLKLQTQQHGPTYNLMHDAVKRIPLTPTAKDYDIVFRSTAGFASSRLNFTTASRLFWLDNVQLEQVSVSCPNLTESHKLIANPTPQDLSVTLTDSYRDVDGNAVSGQVVLPPFSSRVLIREQP